MSCLYPDTLTTCLCLESPRYLSAGRIFSRYLPESLASCISMKPKALSCVSENNLPSLSEKETTQQKLILLLSTKRSKAWLTKPPLFITHLQTLLEDWTRAFFPDLCILVYAQLTCSSLEIEQYAVNRPSLFLFLLLPRRSKEAQNYSKACYWGQLDMIESKVYSKEFFLLFEVNNDLDFSLAAAGQ